MHTPLKYSHASRCLRAGVNDPDTYAGLPIPTKQKQVSFKAATERIPSGFTVLSQATTLAESKERPIAGFGERFSTGSPVWRWGAYAGEFGDAFIKDTSLEGNYR
jgi:hypothetical protein